MTEIWKPIPNFDGYEVSNKGNIRSLPELLRFFHKRFNKIVSKQHLGGIISQQTQKSGYSAIYIHRHGKNIRMHKAVWTAFVGEIPNGFQINHINGVKTDNRLENLELVTPKQNSIYAMKTKQRKLTGTGGKLRNLLSPEDVVAIRTFYVKNKSIKNSAEINKILVKVFDRSISYLSLVAHGKTHAYLE